MTCLTAPPERLAACAGACGRSLAAGLAFGISGCVAGLLVVVVLVAGSNPLSGSPPGAGELGAMIGLIVAAGLAAALVAAPLWWLVVRRAGEPTLLRAGLAGAGVGILAHPLLWVLFGLGAGVVSIVVEGPAAVADLAGRPMALAGSFLLLTVGGVLFTGLLTVPMGAGTGVLVAHLYDRSSDPRSGGGERDPRHE